MRWPGNSRRWWLLGAAAVLWAAAESGSAGAEGQFESPFPNRIKAPEFPEGLAWVNTPRPVELRQLRGKFVLLDFWTYCCINCMHILPELKKLEKAYADELVVIGVHSGKFDEERDAANIAAAIARHHIEHPVVNDADYAIWKQFGTTAWPTIMLIDPEGYAVWGARGEITFEQVDKILRPAVAAYRAAKLLDDRPLDLLKPSGPAEATPLRFPGKVLADESSGRLFIADSNHHRIVVARLDGTLVATIGAGTIGRSDGDAAAAQFNQPQGMALRGNTLYVADTENHLLRKIDLESRRVETVAGTGRQAREMPPLDRSTKPLRTPLSSPWDLWIHKQHLHIAMAGRHQIWRMALDESGIGPYAGNGREDIVDGPLLPRTAYEPGFAAFAQPSGLASDGTWLYVADSEGSSIRAVPLARGEPVRTVVGTASLSQGRLFTFGDTDGLPGDARFQHPLGVVFYGGQIYVADTYNNKIRVVDPATGETRTLAGTRQPGHTDQPPAFDEPAGITAAAGKLFVADTNNHAIRVIELGPSPKVQTLTIAGLKPPGKE